MLGRQYYDELERLRSQANVNGLPGSGFSFEVVEACVGAGRGGRDAHAHTAVHRQGRPSRCDIRRGGVGAAAQRAP